MFKKKVISISNKRTEEFYDDFGVNYLYPEGTIRVIRRYNIFKGPVNVTQVCDIKCAADTGGSVINYNSWKTLKKEYINYWVS